MSYLGKKSPMKKEHVKLSDEDRDHLEGLLSKGSMKSRTYKRIIGLLALDKGLTYERVSERAHMSSRSLKRLAKRYRAEGLDCLYDRPRAGRPVQIGQQLEDKIVLLSCSEAPKGYSQWSLRLLADSIVALGYCDEISHTQVAKILKKRKSSLT